MSRQFSLSSQPVSKSQKLSPSSPRKGEHFLPLPTPSSNAVSALASSVDVVPSAPLSASTMSSASNVQSRTQRIPGQIEGWLTDSSVLLRANSHDESHSIRRIYDIEHDKLSSINLHLSAENDLMSRIRGGFTLLNSDLFAVTDVILNDELSPSTFIHVCSRDRPQITNSFSMPNITALATLRTCPVDSHEPPQIAVVEMRQHSARNDLSNNDVTLSSQRRTVPLSPIVNVDGAISTPLPSSLALSLEFRCHYLTTDGATTHVTPLARVALVQEPVATHAFAIPTDSDEVWVCVVCAFSDCPTPYKDHEGLPITAPDVRLILIRMSRSGVSAVTIRDAHLLKLRCVDGELNANEYSGFFCGGRLLLRCEDHLFWFYPDSALFTLWDIRWLLTDSVEEDTRNDRKFVVSDSILVTRPSASFLVLNSPSHGLMSIDVHSNAITSIDELPISGKLFIRGHNVISVKEEKDRSNIKASRSTCRTKISPILIEAPSALQRKPSIGPSPPTLNLTETPSPAAVVRRHSLPVSTSIQQPSQTAKRKL